MQTIFEAKEQVVTETPLVLFECTLRSGAVERWSTHQAESDGNRYEARVLRHNMFEIQTATDQGVDAIPRISLTLANADSHFSEIERNEGWKGAKLSARFLFYDLRHNTPASESAVLFQGIMNPPEEVTEATFRLTATNRMSMQRVALPEVRIQRRCGWEFPATGAQREESVHGGEEGRYSRFFRCGYSPDVDGGTGNLNGSEPFGTCAYTRADCEARGMFRQDASGNLTRRFGGIEFVPASIQVRSYGEKASHLSPVISNEARYNDFVPLVYGTAWYAPPVVLARNDGNLTHLEVLLGQGEMQSILKVLVNDIEIPAAGGSTATGWFNVVTLGNRTGNFNLDFEGGDPYGSMACASVVVPNRINDGKSLPSIKVLAQGLRLPFYGPDGAYIEDRFTNNPVWVMLDMLRRAGWRSGEIDFASFVEAAAYCDEPIEMKDLHGNAVVAPRFQCNAVVQKRRSAGDLIRGIRNCARLFLTYGTGGKLRAAVENGFALQQASKPEGSNSSETLDGGWPAYEFDESNIVRRANGESSVRVWARSTTDTPNRLTVEFQDAFNEYQQDSYSLVDTDDVACAGQEISAALAAVGLPHFDQAGRILKFQLDKLVRGNTFVEFETSVKALGLRPGDLIALTYLKEGFTRQPFRVVKIAPGTNFRTARITAQIHQDAWYSDTNGQGENPGGRRDGGFGLGIPRPLLGSVVDDDGQVQFGVSEEARQNADGVQVLDAVVEFNCPRAPDREGPGIPLVSLAATIRDEGPLAGDQTLYYAVSAVDSAGRESALSFIVRATIPAAGAGHSVVLTGLSFSADTTAFHVYRGPNPTQLRRIAADQPPITEFTDTGLEDTITGPPDPNFDHANFYWRLELLPESTATAHSANTIGNASLQMVENQYRGMTARITRGKGAGQERTVAGNTATSITLGSEWTVEPDATSKFVIAEAGWHFGATTKASPVTFEIPNRAGAVVEISGRAANVNDIECSPELSPVTRWTVGGAGHSDAEAPPAPAFNVALASRAGLLELSGVSFEDPTNTRSATAGSLSLYYWDELTGGVAPTLAGSVGSEDDRVELSGPVEVEAGSYAQIEGEIVRVEEVLNGGSQWRVTRAVSDSAADAHAAGRNVYPLKRRIIIVPFPRDFFGSPASGDWSYPIVMPDVRLACAEMLVTNDRGNGPAKAICFTQTKDFGLRTLSGGQYTMQVNGYLAIDSAATPDLVVEAGHAVRDIFAVVNQPPVGSAVTLAVKQNDDTYCTLTIPDGEKISNVVDGFGLPALAADARLRLEVTAVGATTPGADLTVVVRL